MTNYWGIHHGKKVYPIQNYRILCLILFKLCTLFDRRKNNVEAQVRCDEDVTNNEALTDT